MSKNNYDLDNLFKKLDNFGGIDALSELLNNPDINKINNENLPDLNEVQKVLNALENPNDLDENDLIELDNIISEWEKNDEMNKNFNKKNDFSSKNKIGNLIQDLKKAGEYKKQKDLNKNETISKEEKKKLFEQLLMGMKLKAESNEKISEKEKKLGKLMNILKNKMPNENEEGSRYKTYTVERKYEPKDITRFDNSSNLREGKPIITEEIINDGNKKIRKYEKKQNYQDGNTYKESHVQIIEETNNGNNNDIKFNYYKDIKDNFDEDEKEFEKEFNKKHYNFKTYNPDSKNMKNSGPIVHEEIINDGNKKIRKYEKKESKNNGDTIHESHYEEVVEETNNNNIPQSNYYRNKNTFNKIEDNFDDDFDEDYKLNKNVFKTYNPNNNTKFTAHPIEREEIINDGNKKIKKYEKKHASNDGNTYKESHVEIIEETDNGNNNNNINTNYYKSNFDEDEKEFEKEFNKKHYNFKTYNPDSKNMKNSGPIVHEEIINDGNKKIRKYEKKESKNNGDTIHESHYEEVVEETNNNNIPQSNYYKSQKSYKSNKVQNNYYDDKFNNDFMDSNLDKITDHIDDEDFEREVKKMENQLNNELNNFGNNYQNYSSKTYSKVYKKNYNNNNYIDNQDEFNNDNNNNDFNNDNRSTTTQYSNTYNNRSYKKKKY